MTRWGAASWASLEGMPVMLETKLTGSVMATERHLIQNG